MTLTASDALALEFFEEQLQYVKNFGLSNLEREERRLFNQGKKVAEGIVTMAKVAANPRTAEATRWTPEEYATLAAAYVRHGADERACLSEFRCYSERHSDYAVRLAVNSCKFLDTKVKDAKGLHDYANGLLAALQEFDADRFQGRR